MSKWYRFEKSASDSTVDLYIYDFIGDWVDHYWGFGVTAQDFLQTLRSLTHVAQLRVHINSPGGDVFSGLTIANLLRDMQAKGVQVTTIVDGIAASAATLIAMAGSTIQMADNALLMIHDPYTGRVGDAKAMRQAATELDTVTDAIVATYRWHTALSAAEIRTLMADTTYMTAAAAVEAGFATEVITSVAKSATFPPEVIAKLRIPERHRAIAARLTQPARSFAVAKTDTLRKQCFGWASVAVTVDGTAVVDSHEHVIAPEDLEKAAYDFNLEFRAMDAGHTAPVCGRLIESVVVTPEKLASMGLPQNALPQGWWVGFQVDDDAVFQKVVSGEFTMFSIAGTAIPVPVEP
jgi:ATP-dependent protease ClpP protease subunit